MLSEDRSYLRPVFFYAPTQIADIIAINICRISADICRMILLINIVPAPFFSLLTNIRRRS